jgi:hypothetical protein
MFLAQAIFGITYSVFQNWAVICNPDLKEVSLYGDRCPDIGSLDIKHPTILSLDWSFFILMERLSYINFIASMLFYLLGNWLIGFRYFEVAEMLGRKDKTVEKHLKAREFTSMIRTVVVVLTVVAFSAVIGRFCFLSLTDLTKALKIVHVISVYTCAFICLDVALMYIGLAWICHSLQNDKKVMGNERLMAVHCTILLVIVAGP